MKKICFLAGFALLITVATSAQVSKTRWTGTMQIPGEGGNLTSVPVTWIFAKDTLTVELGGGEPEIFTYKDAKKVLTLSKVSGGSPCPEGAKVTMMYTIKSDELVFTNQTSDCDTYKRSTGVGALTKVK